MNGNCIIVASAGTYWGMANGCVAVRDSQCGGGAHGDRARDEIKSVIIN